MSYRVKLYVKGREQTGILVDGTGIFFYSLSGSTRNQYEWEMLCNALDYIKNCPSGDVTVYMDSKLILSHVNYTKHIKDPYLKETYYFQWNEKKNNLFFSGFVIRYSYISPNENLARQQL